MGCITVRYARREPADSAYLRPSYESKRLRERDGRCGGCDAELHRLLSPSANSEQEARSDVKTAMISALGDADLGGLLAGRLRRERWCHPEVFRRKIGQCGGHCAGSTRDSGIGL